MDLQVECPECNRRFQVDRSSAGLHAECRFCGRRFRIPYRSRVVVLGSEDIADESKQQIPLVKQKAVQSPTQAASSDEPFLELPAAVSTVWLPLGAGVLFYGAALAFVYPWMRGRSAFLLVLYAALYVAMVLPLCVWAMRTASTYFRVSLPSPSWLATAAVCSPLMLGAVIGYAVGQSVWASAAGLALGAIPAIGLLSASLQAPLRKAVQAASFVLGAFLCTATGPLLLAMVVSLALPSSLIPGETAPIAVHEVKASLEQADENGTPRDTFVGMEPRETRVALSQPVAANVPGPSDLPADPPTSLQVTNASVSQAATPSPSRQIPPAVEPLRPDPTPQERATAADRAGAGIPADGIVVTPLATNEPARPPARISDFPKRVGDAYINSTGMRLVNVPAGEFTMGAPATEEGSNPDEQPQRRVRITRPFLMSIHEVTRGQFAAFVKSSGYVTDAEREGWAVKYTGNKNVWARSDGASWRNPGFDQTDEHPAVMVSWNDAVAFCEWLSVSEGRRYRLPTEAEWEYAARAGGRFAYIWGANPSSGAGWGNVPDLTARQRFEWGAFKWQDGFVFTAPVGRFRANRFGLYDVTGNVWEWCADAYAPAYSTSETVDPTGPTDGTHRVRRGGSYSLIPMNCRVARRKSSLPSERSDDFGFRVAMELD